MARILAVHAHPDDVEILAGGTLTLLSNGGHHVTIVTMTPGDCGSQEVSSEAISSIRRNEAARAASLIQAEYVCAEFRDMAIFNDDSSRRRVVELLRSLRPDIVLTASPQDYLIDHETTSDLLRDACFAASMRLYQTGAPQAARELASIPHLYFLDPLGGIDRNGNPVEADFYIDVQPAFENKRQLLSQHASQRNWLRRQHGVDDYLAAMERWTRERGRCAGRELAEGFRQYRGHPYPQSPLIQELLGTAVIFPKTNPVT